MAEILIVDDDQAVATAFERFLKHEGHGCTLASSAMDAMRLVEEVDPDLVVMDIRMPGVDGLQALQQLRTRHPDLYVVMMTAYGTSQTSIDAIRSGAFDYLTKPLDLDQLRAVIKQALAAKESRERASDRDEEPKQPRVNLVGGTPAMLEVYKIIGRLATIEVPALVVGERGTGKELVVATIHQNSSRHEQRFLTVDCEASPEHVIETELFSDATGTLHLAGVHALPRALQTRLARVVGAGAARLSAREPFSARVIASTDQDLAALSDAGTFSRELYETLSVITLRIPPLRERRDDISVLVRHFIERMNDELDRAIKGVDEQVIRRFQEYAWPGNVGELESVVKRACIITRGDIITIEQVADGLSETRLPGRKDVETDLCRAVRLALQERLVETATGTPSSIFHEIVGLVESTIVKEALQITNGNQVKASDLLGVNRATLRKKALGGD